jgi:hypothetical protein
MATVKTKAQFVKPMLLLRTGRLPESQSLQYEVKVDGYRAIAFKSGGKSISAPGMIRIHAGVKGRAIREVPRLGDDRVSVRQLAGGGERALGRRTDGGEDGGSSLATARSWLGRSSSLSGLRAGTLGHARFVALRGDKNARGVRRIK